MLIRSATVEDAPAISALVTASAREHIASSLSDGGLSHLLSEMTTENQAKRIRNGYQFFVALEADTLVGNHTSAKQDVGARNGYCCSLLAMFLFAAPNSFSNSSTADSS